MSGVPGEKQDRYEQLLAKYDWHAAEPPRGYQYGVGRGARPFSTTAELSIGVNVGADTREESDFFSAMDRLEVKPRKKRDARGTGEEDDAEKTTSGASTNAVKLCLDDLVGLEGLSNTAAAPGGLVARSARTDEGELAEAHLFSDDTSVVTTNDILRGMASTKEATLTSLLDMGSPEEQSTWVTRARALRELGQARKAQATLIEGCAVTGHKGTLIWEERLRYVSASANPVARRRLLEEATKTCPHAEKLWLERIDALPAHLQLDCMQQAVLACPSSESLWLRMVEVTPSVTDQRKLIQRAVQQTPNLPRLWAKLAHQVPYEAGKDIFRQVSHQHPSLELAVEAVKFVEDHLVAPTEEQTSATATGAHDAISGSVGASMRVFARLETAAGFDEMSSQVHVAQQRYLDVTQPWSRRNWLTLAKEAATGLSEDSAPSALSSASPSASPSPLAPRSTHVWTAAFFVLYCARPTLPSALTLSTMTTTTAATHGVPYAEASLPSTWVEDMLSFLPDVNDDYVMLSAVSGAYLLQLLPRFCTSRPLSASPLPSWPVMRAAGTPQDTQERFHSLLKLLRRALESIPETELDVVANGVTLAKSSAANTTNTTNTTTATAQATTLQNEEEEEEELAGLSAASPPASASTTTAAATATNTSAAHRSVLLDVLCGAMQLLLRPFSIVRTSHATAATATTASAPGGPSQATPPAPAAADHGTAVAEAAVLQSRLALVVASGFRARGRYEAALAVLAQGETCLAAYMTLITTQRTDVTLRLNERAQLEDGLVHLLVAAAGCHERLQQPAQAAQCLARATTQCPNASSDVAWVGLILHQRSSQSASTVGVLSSTATDTRGAVQELVSEALRAHPRSATVWRIQLELAADALTRAKASGATAATNSDEQTRQTLFRLSAELRQLCQRALSPAHCRSSASLWAYVAVTIEATLLNSGPTARALIAEAMTVCCPARHAMAASSSSSSSDRRAQHARALLSLALARVELLQGGGREPAHEVVADALRALPKTREGAFLLPVGELQQLSIDLEVPNLRGRAAMQVMEQWKSREPLALVAVAKFYHLAKHYDRALSEAIKAVRASRVTLMAATSGASGTIGGGATGSAEDVVATLPLSASAYYHLHSHQQSDILYGDPLALLWKLASLPEYAKPVATRLGTFSEDELEALAALPEEVTRDWAFSTISEALGGSSAPETPPNTTADTHKADTSAWLRSLVPNAGPVWLAATEDVDAASVTLTGYRQDTEVLLRKAVEHMVL